MSTTIVPPVVLASILPFGVTEEQSGNEMKRYFRFSLSIDLKSVYEEGNEPDYTKLKKFICCYGVGNGSTPSLYEQLLNNINVEIYQTGTPVPKVVPVLTAFDEFKKNDAVKKYWKYFNIDTLDSISQQQQQGELQSATAYRSNQMASNGIGTFYNPKRDSSDSIYKMAVDHFLQIQDTAFAKSFADTLKTEAEGLQSDIETFNKALQGINSYSEGVMQQQSSLLFSKNKISQHNNIADSTESIFSTFSFIHSNIILQRLFGVTIDFKIEATDTVIQQMGKPFIIRIVKNSFSDILLNTGCECLYLQTPMKLFSNQGKQIIVIDEHPAIQPKPQEYFARNYDLGAKLKSLSSLNEKVENFFGKLHELENAGPESSRRQLMNEWIKLDTAAFTRGMNVYNKDSAVSIESERSAGNAQSNENTIYLKDIVKGYRAAIIGEQDQVHSLGLRKVNLRGLKLPVEFETQDFAFHADTASHALVEEKNEDGTTSVKEKLLVDTAVLNWAGENIGVPSIFSNTEEDINFEATLDEGSISAARQIVTETFSSFFTERYKIRGVEYKREKKPRPDSLSKYIIDDTDETKAIQITYQAIKNQRLIFGNAYHMVLTPEYKNGWAVPFNSDSQMPGLIDLTNKNGMQYHLHEVPTFVFKKNEPVKNVQFFSGHRLLDENNQAVTGREGESLLHLVIRNYSKKQDQEKGTSQISIRYILPPPIAFEHAFWYNKIFEMSVDESYKWYQKYHFPNDNVDGSVKMKEFYSDGCPINYLSDPLCAGFRFEFYLDHNYTIKAKKYEKYEEQEYYFSGNYPYINAWKLVLKDIDYDEPLVEYENEEIFLRLEKGQELFVEVRTILSDSYEQTFETFGNYNDFTKYGGNDLLTPVLKFSVTHAVQRPLVKPKFDNTILSLKEKQGTTILRIENILNLEQTSIYEDNSNITRYIPDTLPAGNIEFYAKWEDYSDDPRHITVDNWTPDMPVNKVNLTQLDNIEGESPAIFETKIELNTQQLKEMEKSLARTSSGQNEYKNFAVKIAVSYDVKETKFMQKWFWVINKSKFTSCYPAAWSRGNDEELSLASGEHFNRVSAAPFLINILNNKKPAIPELDDRNITLVAVNEDWKEGRITKRKASMNRLRFYFKRGRLTSGKGERIGFVLNEPASKYNDLWVANQLVSTVGKDIVSDSASVYDGLYRTKAVLLNKSNFVIHDPYDIDFPDLESFSPKYIEDLGIMTYLPKFDKKNNCWYLEIELDINDQTGKELHSPFVRFAMVHYQENSQVYLSEGVAGDCRISEIQKSGYVYIMGTRTVSLDIRPSEVRIKLQYDITSLKKSHFGQTRFYAVAQKKADGEIKWHIADRDKKDDKGAFVMLESIPSSVQKLTYLRSGGDYRLVILETEEWDHTIDTDFESLINNKNNRIVFVSLFDI